MKCKPPLLSLLLILLASGFSLNGAASEIHEAIARHDVNSVRRIIANTPGCISQRDEDSYLPLHLAAMGGDLEICKALIEAGAKADASTQVEHTTGSIDAVAAQGKEVGKLPPTQQAIVLNAAGLVGGYTALQLAVQEGKIAVCQYLLSVGANPNARDPMKQTALHIAINTGHPDIALLMITKGAEVDATDNHGYTPMQKAAGERQVKVVDALLQAKAIPCKKDNYGGTPLMAAIEWDDGGQDDKPYPQEQTLTICRMLISKGCDVNAVEKDQGLTALLLAATNYQAGISKLLLESKADPNALLQGKSTALDIVDMFAVPIQTDDEPGMRTLKKEATEIKRLLIKYGGKNNSPYSLF